MIVYDSPEITEWAAQRLFNIGMEYWGPCRSIGQFLEGKIISAVIYNNFERRPDNTVYCCEMSVASIDKRWANKPYLKAIFAYPFIQLGLERVQIRTSIHNEGANSLVSRLGYIKEGKHRSAFWNGDDCYSWSMLKDDCKWF